MVVCRDHCYVLSVPDADANPHGKFATNDCSFVHDLAQRIQHAPQRCAMPSTFQATSYDKRLVLNEHHAE